MSFTFNKCISNKGIEIKGLYEVIPVVHCDGRGYFYESYKEKDFFDAGLKMSFVQDNESMSSSGVLRGLHFQTKHPQGKLIRCLAGSFYDVAVDLRNGSETFGQYCGIILDSNKHNEFYIPEGFAHGFYVISENAICSYKCTAFYDPDGESGIMWNDPLIGIDWNKFLNGRKPILSEKDTNREKFSTDLLYFDINGKWIGK